MRNVLFLFDLFTIMLCVADSHCVIAPLVVEDFLQLPDNRSRSKIRDSEVTISEVVVARFRHE